MRFPHYDEMWEKFALSDITQRVRRKNKNNETNLPLTVSAQYGLIAQNLFFDRQIASKDMSNYYLLLKGEFAYNKSYSNDYEWGTVKRLDLYDMGALSSLYFCFSPKTDKVNSDWLLHYFETTKWHRGISDIAGEGARNHGLLNMSVEDYFATLHYLPKIKEQAKIADFFNLLTERIETQSKIIEKLQSQMKAIIDSLIDFSAPQVKFEKLYNVASEGGTPATNNQAYYENGNIPFIKIDDLTEKYIVCHKEHISELGLKNSSAWLIPENSVIYSNGATVGRVAINTYPITTKQGILGIVPSKNILTEYLYYLMKTTYFRREVCRITVKGTMECAYLKDLNTITCYLPSIDKQKRTLKLLHSLDEQLELQKLLLHKLKEQKKYLLSNMFI